jgi:hypothetical protein
MYMSILYYTLQVPTHIPHPRRNHLLSRSPNPGQPIYLSAPVTGYMDKWDSRYLDLNPIPAVSPFLDIIRLYTYILLWSIQYTNRRFSSYLLYLDPLPVEQSKSEWMTQLTLRTSVSPSMQNDEVEGVGHGGTLLLYKESVLYQSYLIQYLPFPMVLYQFSRLQPSYELRRRLYTSRQSSMNSEVNWWYHLALWCSNLSVHVLLRQQVDVVHRASLYRRNIWRYWSSMGLFGCRWSWLMNGKWKSVESWISSHAFSSSSWNL